MGSRISDMVLNGKPLAAGKGYKVAGWASVQEGGGAGGKPVWELAEQWLRAQKGSVKPRRINTPVLTGAQGNPGLSAEG
jgi:sulfur-oxidizing protein SoxB